MQLPSFFLFPGLKVKLAPTTADGCDEAGVVEKVGMLTWFATGVTESTKTCLVKQRLRLKYKRGCSLRLNNMTAVPGAVVCAPKTNGCASTSFFATAAEVGTNGVALADRLDVVVAVAENEDAVNGEALFLVAALPNNKDPPVLAVEAAAVPNREVGAIKDDVTADKATFPAANASLGESTLRVPRPAPAPPAFSSALTPKEKPLPGAVEFVAIGTPN